MKRFICAFTALLMVFCISISPFIKVSAYQIPELVENVITDPFNLGLKEADYIALGELSFALSQGASISWDDLDLDDPNLTDGEKVRKMLAYYRLKMYGTVGDVIVDFSENFEGNNSEIAAISFKANSGLTNGTLNSIDTQFTSRLSRLNNGNTNYGDDTHIYMQYNNNTIAFWNRYSKTYINKYLETMNSVEEDEPAPEPVIPSELLPYIEAINGTGFDRLANWEQSYVWGVNEQNAAVQIPVIDKYPLSDYSIIRQNYNTTNSNNWNFAQNLCICPIQTININSSGTNFYLATATCPAYDGFNVWTGGANPPLTKVSTALFRLDISGSILNNVSSSNPTAQTFWTQTMSGTLESILSRISINMRNVNIYVDGELWSSARGNSNVDSDNEQLVVTIPNGFVDDNNYIVSNPIFYPDTGELTNGDLDAKVDLDKLAKLISEKMSQGETSIDIDDTLDDKDWVDSLARPITQTIPKTIAEVLQEVETEPETETDPKDKPSISLDLGVVPALPTLPKMPARSPGFNGVSVLARIINFTNQSMPQQLILTFWGVVFGMIILGIIKILHK